MASDSDQWDSDSSFTGYSLNEEDRRMFLLNIGQGEAEIAGRERKNELIQKIEKKISEMSIKNLESMVDLLGIAESDTKFQEKHWEESAEKSQPFSGEESAERLPRAAAEPPKHRKKGERQVHEMEATSSSSSSLSFPGRVIVNGRQTPPLPRLSDYKNSDKKEELLKRVGREVKLEAKRYLSMKTKKNGLGKRERRL